MAYAPAKLLDAPVSASVTQQEQTIAASFNPLLQAIEAVVHGGFPSVPLVMTDEERAGRRAILANPGPPSAKLVAALAARRRLNRAGNEI